MLRRRIQRKKRLPKFNRCCKFQKDFDEKRVLVYKPDGKREEPNGLMNENINKWKPSNVHVYAILDSSMTYDYLYYSYEDEDVDEDEKKIKKGPKFGRGSKSIFKSPAISINKSTGAKDGSDITVKTVEINNCIESLERVYIEEVEKNNYQAYIDHYLKEDK